MKRRIYRYLHAVTAPERSGVVWFDLIEIGLATLGFLLYFLVRGAVIDRTSDALANARWIVGLQSSLGLYIEPVVNRWVLESAPLLTMVNFVYFWLDFPLILAVGLVLFWKRRNSYTLLRDALLLSGALALILYWTFPVAPPRFLKEWGFVDTLAQYSNLAYQTQSTKPFVNPFAAVPSLHVGWAVLLAVALFHATDHLLVRVGAIVNLVLQSISVVATANHYIFDGVVGVAIAFAGLGAAVLLQRRGYPSLREWFGGQAAMVAAREHAAPVARDARGG
ncbi:MAG: phosphatase PAP2 family protein [Candidatus Rokubacteria bacterium]|nr:phosphatase PAP2 family protein [Chloroflexota bacterium]MBM4441401.1 phosphatase PAP2 family protein [Candidatus Rokubacteria bacterium]